MYRDFVVVGVFSLFSGAKLIFPLIDSAQHNWRLGGVYNSAYHMFFLYMCNIVVYIVVVSWVKCSECAFVG